MELIIQYIVFGVWPLLISLTVLRTIRVVICIRSCVQMNSLRIIVLFSDMCVCVCINEKLFCVMERTLALEWENLFYSRFCLSFIINT